MAILNFQKPDKVIMIDSTDFEGKFEFRPLEPGYGLTVGNALRRVLLSSLEGFAITSVRIEGVEHEFSTIAGVVEDVTEIVLNLKQVRFKRQALRHAGPRGFEVHCDKRRVVDSDSHFLDGGDKHETVVILAQYCRK